MLVKRRRRLSEDEIDELVAAYQRTATHLSVLRSGWRDPALTARLSARSARPARPLAARTRQPCGRSAEFFAVAFPLMAYRVRWWWLAYGGGIIVVARGRWWVARTHRRCRLASSRIRSSGPGQP